MATKVMPLKRGTYSTSSGYRSADRPDHRGVDFAAPAGTPIYAVADGLVVRTGPADGFGQWIVVDHQAEHGVDTVYGHLYARDLLVRVGQRVTAGQVIARVGSNGQSSGPHLHFEMWGPPGRFGGSDRNPTAWLTGATEPGATEPGAPAAPAWTETGSTLNDRQFTADIDILTTADSGPRDPRSCQFWGLHTTENSDDAKPEDIARWQQNRANQSSYQILVGADATGARIVRGNDDNYIPWSAGSTGNRRGLHLAFVGRASRTREQWLANDKQLRAGARVVADWCRRYGLPNTKITAEQLRAGIRGGVGHGDISAAWREVDHTDPGPHFPWDTFTRYVNTALAGTLTPDEEDVDMSAVEQINGFTAAFNGAIGSDVKDIRDQIIGGRDAGEYKGHPQIDDRTVVDALAVIGAHLGIPGFVDPHGGSLKAKHQAQGGR